MHAVLCTFLGGSPPHASTLFVLRGIKQYSSKTDHQTTGIHPCPNKADVFVSWMSVLCHHLLPDHLSSRRQKNCSVMAGLQRAALPLDRVSQRRLPCATYLCR